MEGRPFLRRCVRRPDDLHWRSGRRRLRIPRPAAVGITLLLAVLLFSGVAMLVSISVTELAANAAGYQRKTTEMLRAGMTMLPLERFGIDESAVWIPLREFSMGALGNLLLGTTTAVLDLLKNGLLVAQHVVSGLGGDECDQTGVGPVKRSWR